MTIGQQLRRISYIIGGILLTASLVGARASNAATYYAATTGSDSNPGTQGNPFRTVNKGVSVLTPGDTLYIRGGTYAESLENVIPGGTDWSLPVTVSAYGTESVTLRPNSGASRVLAFNGGQFHHIIVNGLRLDGTNVSFDVVQIGDSTATCAAHHIRIQNSELMNAPGMGVLTSHHGSCSADFNEFINLTIHDNGLTDKHHGYYLTTADNLIEGNDIYRNSGRGIQAYSSGGWNVHRNVIRNNRIHHNGRTDPSPGISVANGDANQLYNNLIYGNPYGIQLDYGPANTKLWNNTIAYNQGPAIVVFSQASGSEIRNNLIFGNSADEIQNSGSGTVQDRNLIGTDPKFVNAAAFNFALLAGSPAINQGVKISAVANDYARVLRPQGGAYEIGAYEYTDGTPLAAPAAFRILAIR
jgi:parallel beta-helix repeat protein